MSANEKLKGIVAELRRGQRRAQRRAKLRSIWAVIWPRLEVLRLRSLLHIVVAQKELLHKEIASLKGQCEQLKGTQRDG